MFNDRYGLTQAAIEGRKTVTRRLSGISAYPRYKVGEIVAVAQSYNDATKEYPHLKTTLVGHDIMGSEPGCRNKMFVRADLMPHRICITDVRCERLQEISDADCLREGIFVNEYFGNGGKCRHYGFDGFLNGREGWFARGWYDTPRAAFASLIDNVSGLGTWERNPWVVVYEFEMVR